MNGFPSNSLTTVLANAVTKLSSTGFLGWLKMHAEDDPKFCYRMVNGTPVIGEGHLDKRALARAGVLAENVVDIAAKMIQNDEIRSTLFDNAIRWEDDGLCYDNYPSTSVYDEQSGLVLCIEDGCGFYRVKTVWNFRSHGVFFADGAILKLCLDGTVVSDETKITEVRASKTRISR